MAPVPQFDPESAPLDPAFADPAVRGTALEPHRLTPQALRAHFARPQIWQPENLFDVARPRELQELHAVAPTPAAVLIPLLVRDGAVQVALTQRTAHLTDHAGQISFPGGRIEPQDANAVAAALRESQEEIGLEPHAVEVLGTLSQYVTVTHYLVTPVVGLIEPVPLLAPDTHEVAEIFEVPLSYLMNPAHHERRWVPWNGGAGTEQRSFLAMPYTAARRYFIWGATAAMLRNLYRFLSAERGLDL